MVLFYEMCTRGLCVDDGYLPWIKARRLERLFVAWLRRDTQ